MSWFNFGKQKKVASLQAKDTPVPAVAPPLPKKLMVREEAERKGEPRGARAGFRAGVLLRPRITEKASTGGARGVYAFEVAPHATKKEISDAVQALYAVSPVKIAVVRIPRKHITFKGIRGTTGGGKKAYVYLKQGDKLELV